MKKKQESFEPEKDGKGAVYCPAKGNDMKKVNQKQNGGIMAEALKKAGLSR